jgi:hypothetical protein
MYDITDIDWNDTKKGHQSKAQKEIETNTIEGYEEPDQLDGWNDDDNEDHL